jgi:hypothetical protein
MPGTLVMAVHHVSIFRCLSYIYSLHQQTLTRTEFQFWDDDEVISKRCILYLVLVVGNIKIA